MKSRLDGVVMPATWEGPQVQVRCQDPTKLKFTQGSGGTNLQSLQSWDRGREADLCEFKASLVCFSDSQSYTEKKKENLQKILVITGYFCKAKMPKNVYKR